MFRPRFKDFKLSRRPIGLLFAAGIMAGGVAFALLQSQADLTGNSIRTDSAGLLISRDGSGYASSASGYDFVHIIPGSRPSQAEHLSLQNTGSAPLALRLGTTADPDNPNGIDLSKVDIILTPYDMATLQPDTGASQSFTLQSLMDVAGGVPVDSPSALASGSTERFDIQISMDTDAVSGSGAALSNLDLQFTGVATDTE